MKNPQPQFIHKVNGVTQYITQKLELSANVAGLDLNDNLVGGYLHSVEVGTSDVGAVTVDIKTGISGSICKGTTANANVEAKFIPVMDRYTVNSTPNLTLTGLTTGTATIEIVVVKK